MADDEGADDSEAAHETESALTAARTELERQEMQIMLGGEYDRLGAIVSIHPGAGGTEAQDWAEMLLRLYLRWAERRGFKSEIADLQPGEGGGIKSATFTVDGDLRLWLSAGRSGHPSAGADLAVRFQRAASYVVRVDVCISRYRRQGRSGDQSGRPAHRYVSRERCRGPARQQNGFSGAHDASADGIVVTCQNERSQHKNRAMAMKILRARLFEMEERKRREELEKFSKDKKEIAWGSQIRSYVLHPYQMVKDHRTGVEIGNTNAVLDGAIDQFIEAYLMGVRKSGAESAPA